MSAPRVPPTAWKATRSPDDSAFPHRANEHPDAQPSRSHHVIFSQAPTALRLAPDAVHLWRAELDRADHDVAALHALLTAEERGRVTEHRTEELRRRAAVSRGLLRCVLARYLAIAPEAVQLRSAAYGKPFLASGPHPSALRFNLSHSGAVALLAIAWGREIGVDVESLGRALDYERIIARFLSRDEQRMLRALPPALRRRAFFTCWVRKEAYAKARGMGLSLPFERFTVSVNPGEPAALLAVEEELDDSSRWTLRDVPAHGGYVAALAVEGPGCALRCFRWPRSPRERPQHSSVWPTPLPHAGR